MEAGQKKATSIVAASIVAALTLSVFFVSLNKGPASAVTRFHEGLARPSAALVREVTGGDVNSPEAMALRQKIVVQYLQPGWSFQVTRINKGKSDAVVHVVYESPSRELASVPFALHKVNESWLIDSGA